MSAWRGGGAGCSILTSTSICSHEVDLPEIDNKHGNELIKQNSRSEYALQKNLEGTRESKQLDMGGVALLSDVVIGSL